MIPVKEISTQSVDMEFHSVAWGENKMVLDERTYEARANSRSPIAEFHAYWRASTEFRPVEDLPHINVQFLDMSDKNPANWSFRRHAGIFEGISNVANIHFDALRSVLLQDYMQTMRDGQPSYQLLQQDFSGRKR